jgi:hypothetical protein
MNVSELITVLATYDPDEEIYMNLGGCCYEADLQPMEADDVHRYQDYLPPNKKLRDQGKLLIG